MNAVNPIINQAPGVHHPGKIALNRKVSMILVIAMVLLGLLILAALASKGQQPQQSVSTQPATQQTNSRNEDGQVPLKLAQTIDKSTEVKAAPDKPVAQLVPSAPPIPVQPTLTLEKQRAMAFEQQMLDYRQQQLISAMSSDTVVQMSPASPQNAPGNTLSDANAAIDQLSNQATMLGQQLARQSTMPTTTTQLAATPSDQQQKRGFLAESRQTDYLSHTRETALSPYELKVGTIIPAVLTSGINSDLPGQVVASVSQNVYDSATGQHLLIPQGAKLYGVYDSQIAYGQSRVLLAWSRINFPDGTTLNLDTMGGMDVQGYSGFEDKVDNHYFKIFGNALLLGIISGATQAGVSDGDSNNRSVSESVADGVTQQFGQTGSTLIQKNLDVQPRIIIRNGYRFNVMVNKDVMMTPYRH